MGHGNMMSNVKMNTEGVKMLLGDPQKAIVHLSIPIFFSLVASGILHITDMIWVSGLGPEALSGVGFFVPLYMVASAVATGIGVGGGTCIAQSIGGKDKKGADQFTVHMFIILLFLAVLLFFFLLFSSKPLFMIMGAENSIDKALAYTRIMTPALIFLLFTEGAYAVFRSEGNAKVVMAISVTGVVINMILDPIFIYSFGLGVAGAAWASLIALLIAALICCFRLLIKKGTYVSIKFKGFKLKRTSISQILHLGVPVFINQILMSLMIFVTIRIITQASGENGVAVFSAGLRYMHFLVIPIVGISSAAITVIGAAYGAGDMQKIKFAYNYSLKIASIIAIIMLVFTFLTAPFIAMMFTWSNSGNILTEDLIMFLRIVFFGHPPLSVALVAGSLFTGIGKSINALVLEIIRNIILTLPLIIIFGILLDLGLPGIWSGMVFANFLSAAFAFLWARKLFSNADGKIMVSLKKGEMI